MKSLNPYLMFPGTCKEALVFYQSCLGGKISNMQTFGESPVPVADEHKERIFNSEFRSENVFFMASDDLPTHQVKAGTNFAMFVNFSDKEEQAAIFASLSEGGRISFPLENGFGMFVDKFGIQWMLASH